MAEVSGVGVVVSAPGKMMISGEYAVLTGAPALVTAVNRRAVLTVVEGDTPSKHPEVVATRALAEAVLGPVKGEFQLDVTQLRSGDVKIGLGSSSAGAAASVAAVFAAHGKDLGSPELLQEMLRLALEGHKSVAPNGSGSDVAAAVLGGLTQFQKIHGSVSASREDWPNIIHRVVWTGTSASTKEMVAQVYKLRDESPSEYERCMTQLTEHAQVLRDAFVNGQTAPILKGVSGYHLSMDKLGRCSGAPIVEERLASIARAAAEHHGAAKPSGAGGGDVAIAFFPSEGDAHAFEAQVSQTFRVLPLQLGVIGAKRER